MVTTQIGMSKEAMQLANALVAALKEPQEPPKRVVTVLPDEIVELAESLDMSDNDVERELAAMWTCEDCGDSDPTAAWSSRFEQVLCRGCDDAAITLANDGMYDTGAAM